MKPIASNSLPSFRKGLIFLLVGMLTSGNVMAGDAVMGSDFPGGRSGLGWAGDDGTLDGWFDVRDHLLLNGGEKLPIRLNFSSNQRNFAASSLGAGWWFPLLESTVVEEDVNVVVLKQPGGDSQRLWIDPKNTSRFATPNDEWVGTLMDDKRFEVQGPRGWRLIYEAGHLKRALTPAGEHLEWIRRADKVVGIRSDQQGELLAAHYTPEGLLKEIQFNRALKDKIQFKAGTRPTIASVQGQSLVTAMLPVAVSIATTKGYSQTLEFDFNEDGQNVLNVSRSLAPWQQPEVVQLIWDAKTSSLLSDGTWDYVCKLRKQGDRSPELTRINKNTGEKEGWYYNQETGVSEQLFTNGVRQIVTTARVAGKTPARKIVEVKPDGTETLLFRASYDAQGRVMRGMQRNTEGEDLAWIVTATPEEVKAALLTSEGLKKLFPEHEPKE